MARIDENDELYGLFVAFDDVSASDELKAATLEKIFAETAGDASGMAAKDIAGGVDEAADIKATTIDTSTIEAVPIDNSAGTLTEESPQLNIKPVTVDAGGKSGRKAKWRAIRVAALAACLALALTGGIAYATPTSHVQVAQENTRISLGVNCFDIVVAADSEDEEGRAVLESTELCNLPREESVERAADSLETMRPEKPVQIDGQPRRPEASEVPAADEPPASDSAGQVPPDGVESGQADRDGVPEGDRPGADEAARSEGVQSEKPSERWDADDRGPNNPPPDEAPDSPPNGEGPGREGTDPGSSQAAFNSHDEGDAGGRGEGGDGPQGQPPR